jgi:hypothetical protein
MMAPHQHRGINRKAPIGAEPEYRIGRRLELFDLPVAEHASL